VVGDGLTIEEQVFNIIPKIQEMLPDEIDTAEIKLKLEIQQDPLTVILYQEIERYNYLLMMVERSLDQLSRGI